MVDDFQPLIVELGWPGSRCMRAVRAVACVEELEVIKKILARLDAKAVEPAWRHLPPTRAPPQGLFE